MQYVNANINMSSSTKELLYNYKNEIVTWKEYEDVFNKMIEERNIDVEFKRDYSNYDRVCLLCSEVLPDNCHRRLVAKKLQEKLEYDIEIVHI